MLFLTTVLTVTADQKSTALVEKVLTFFGSHFIIEYGKTSELSLAHMFIHRTDNPKKFFPRNGKIETDYIRKSTSEFFCIPVEKQSVATTEYFYSKEANVTLHYNKDRKEIQFYCSQEPNSREEVILIETIRDLVLRNEELNGSIVIHAASAEKDGRVVLITGTKGAGKSTFLLELVKGQDYHFYSGDKSFLWIHDNNLMVKGWPDYPHLGLGTISNYPELAAELSLQDEIHHHQVGGWVSDRKVPISPEIFVHFVSFCSPETVAKVEKIVLPDIQNLNNTSKTEKRMNVERVQENIEVVKNHWNGYLDMTNRNCYEKSLKEVLAYLQKTPIVDSI